MIELKHICKTFDSGGGEVEALKDVSLTIEKGEIYGIIGMSGAGKSTLVRCMNLLERPTSGEIWVNGQELEKMTPKELRRARGEITMIFQHFNLLMQRTCLRNVCFPMELGGMKKADAEKRARELLDLVGLPDKANAYPAQLSGGQQQRVAIARALATKPKVLLCDEATSALDPNTTHQILQLIRELNRELGITVVIITHQMSVVKEICDKVAILDGGEVAEEGLVSAVFRPQVRSRPAAGIPQRGRCPGVRSRLGAPCAAYFPGQPDHRYSPGGPAGGGGERLLQCHLRQHPAAVPGGLRQHAPGHPQRPVRPGRGLY